jgi:Tol biopolymer transport system component
VRSLILSAVIVAGLSALVFGRQTPTPAADLPQLAYVATAHQLGVVGYRDPFGAISPDGTRLAYAEGRFIRVVPIGGGSPVTLSPGEGQIRYLAWKGNDEIVAEDRTPAARWWSYRIGDADRKVLWEPKSAATLSYITFSPDARSAAAIGFLDTGPGLVRLDAGGTVLGRTRLTGRTSFPAFRTNNEIACVIDLKVTTPCGGAAVIVMGGREVYGPIAFSPDGNTLYFSSANERGSVDLWSADLATRRSRRLSNFSRDAYAPSMSAGGTVIFKTQTYRTHLADVTFEGGPTRQLTTFQSETPSYHPTRPLIAFTYGTWRRVIDDAKYPDIAQDIGVIDVAPAFRRGISYPAAKPSEVLEDSDSEDQAMTWSPNGRWIAFHSHKDMSDDVWLRPADGAQPDKRITFLGRGAEVGWPRWSPDGRTVLLNGARKSDGASVLYTIGVNQDDGRVTGELREVKVEGITGEMGHAEWMPGSASIVALAKEGPGRHVIFTVPVAGGRAAVVHRFESEHDFSGLGVSSNGRFVAFVAPAPDGYFQIFVKAVGAPTPAVQLTTDRSHKTQPTFAPDNSRVAFTVWSYDAAFWSFKDR